MRRPAHFVEWLVVVWPVQTRTVSLTKPEPLRTVGSIDFGVERVVPARLDHRILREHNRCAPLFVVCKLPARDVHRRIARVVQLHPISNKVALGLDLIDPDLASVRRLLACRRRHLRRVRLLVLHPAGSGIGVTLGLRRGHLEVVVGFRVAGPRRRRPLAHRAFRPAELIN